MTSKQGWALIHWESPFVNKEHYYKQQTKMCCRLAIVQIEILQTSMKIIILQLMNGIQNMQLKVKKMTNGGWEEIINLLILLNADEELINKIKKIMKKRKMETK